MTVAVPSAKTAPDDDTAIGPRAFDSKHSQPPGMLRARADSNDDVEPSQVRIQSARLPVTGGNAQVRAFVSEALKLGNRDFDGEAFNAAAKAVSGGIAAPALREQIEDILSAHPGAWRRMSRQLAAMDPGGQPASVASLRSAVERLLLPSHWRAASRLLEALMDPRCRRERRDELRAELEREVRRHCHRWSFKQEMHRALAHAASAHHDNLLLACLVSERQIQVMNEPSAFRTALLEFIDAQLTPERLLGEAMVNLRTGVRDRPVPVEGITIYAPLHADLNRSSYRLAGGGPEWAFRQPGTPQRAITRDEVEAFAIAAFGSPHIARLNRIGHFAMQSLFEPLQRLTVTCQSPLRVNGRPVFLEGGNRPVDYCLVPGEGSDAVYATAPYGGKDGNLFLRYCDTGEMVPVAPGSTVSISIGILVNADGSASVIDQPQFKASVRLAREDKGT